LCEANLAFCLLVGGSLEEIKGKPFCTLLPDNPECLMLLDEVYRRGKAATLQGQDHDLPGPVFSSYVMWPMIIAGRTSGVVIQVTETAPLHAQLVAMNEALVLGSLRQHELTAIAEETNIRLQSEIVQRLQSERDALMLTAEISHRIKNNLQNILLLISNEIHKTPSEYAGGYLSMEARISAIAALYDLISHTDSALKVPLDSYLQALAKTMSATLLEPSSKIQIEAQSAAVELDVNRAEPFGLLVNELSTNAIKHAFPSGTGRLMLSVRQEGNQLELIVADDGIGMASARASIAGRHGSDYVDIFVRQLGGTMTVSGAPGAGTTVRIVFPLLRVEAVRGSRD
jgi:two-component sensor histidine kinase